MSATCEMELVIEDEPIRVRYYFVRGDVQLLNCRGGVIRIAAANLGTGWQTPGEYPHINLGA